MMIEILQKRLDSSVLKHRAWFPGQRRSLVQTWIHKWNSLNLWAVTKEPWGATNRPSQQICTAETFCLSPHAFLNLPWYMPFHFGRKWNWTFFHSPFVFLNLPVGGGVTKQNKCSSPLAFLNVPWCTIRLYTPQTEWQCVGKVPHDVLTPENLRFHCPPMEQHEGKGSHTVLTLEKSPITHITSRESAVKVLVRESHNWTGFLSRQR